MKHSTPTVLLALILAATGCSDGDGEGEGCDDVPCDNGACATDEEGYAWCTCDDGFAPTSDGLACAPEGEANNDSDNNDGPNNDTGNNDVGRPDALPSFSSLDLFADDSPLNTPIAVGAAAHPQSDAMVQAMEGAGEFVVQVDQYSAPVFFADAGTPAQDVFLHCGEFWELGVDTMPGVRIPPFAEASDDVDGADNPPVGCGEDSDQDNFLVVIDLEARCVYDLWQARRGDDGSWSASFGTGFDLDGSGIHPGGLSARASGFSFVGGMLWPDEVASGSIEHALVASYPFTRTGGPVAPATDSDGVTDDPTALPIGARLQLDPALDLSTLDLSAAEEAIARAMQTYGVFIVDTGGGADIGLYAVDPDSAAGDPWAGVFEAGEDFAALSNIPVSSFRVLAWEGEQDPDFQDKLDFPSDRCAVYE